MTPIQRTISSVRPVLSLSPISLPSIPQPRYNHRREATERSLETAAVVEAQRASHGLHASALRHAALTMCRAPAHGAVSQSATAASDATRADSYGAKGKRVRTSQSCCRTSPTRRGPSRAVHGRGLRPGMHRPFRWAEKPPRAAARRSASLRYVEPRPPPQSPADEARDRKGCALGHDWKQRQKTRTRQSAAIQEARPCQRWHGHRWHGQRWCPPQPATSYKADTSAKVMAKMTPAVLFTRTVRNTPPPFTCDGRWPIITQCGGQPSASAPRNWRQPQRLVRRMAQSRRPGAAGEARTRMPPTCTSTSSSNSAKLRPCSVTWLPMYSACPRQPRRQSPRQGIRGGSARKIRP